MAEAARIQHKHLLTLEGGISINQTNEMMSNSLQLVVPSPIHESYQNEQREWLMSIDQFIGMVKAKGSGNFA